MKQHERTLVRAAAVAAAVAILMSPALAPDAFADAARDRARASYSKGKELYDAGDYKAAITQFTTADRLAPSALLEFNIALCHERLGDGAQAVRHYRSYLQREPSASNRHEVEAKVHQIETDMAAAEAARKAEAARRAPPPPAEPGPAEPPPVEPGPDEQTAAGTGDPELDRVNAIDVASVRDRRGGGGGVAEPPPPGAGAPPPPAGQPEYGAAPPDSGPAPRKAEKPVYKKWWFWAIVGVSALILIDVASSDSSSTNALVLPDQSRASSPGSAVLWRF